VRLLVDANLSPRVARRLGAAGHDAVHVAEVGLLAATDLEIATYAATEQRVIATSDSDFGSILARTGERSPSIVLLRHHNDATPERHIELIETALSAAAAELAEGAIVTISRARLRVRRLPIT
jgi:predicted nuclease of predicted toxin-antitoxin system